MNEYVQKAEAELQQHLLVIKATIEALRSGRKIAMWALHHRLVHCVSNGEELKQQYNVTEEEYERWRKDFLDLSWDEMEELWYDPEFGFRR